MRHKQQSCKVVTPVNLPPKREPASSSWWCVPDCEFKAALARETPRILGQSNGVLTLAEKPISGKAVKPLALEDDEV